MNKNKIIRNLEIMDLECNKCCYCEDCYYEIICKRHCENIHPRKLIKLIETEFNGLEKVKL